ncbi:PREDICTED: ATPase WRNIP1-like isoform X2 [Priapulus caudatus]|uniref:ATPase WRNIP1-like isoform X2 n=1 Tax=Priapulus caudatus TaxID=37621 RepID=A0ABM1EGB0_PRICU|nr:PREDICTED: ATPase WRNIP1-like isoform X2 [Priapulus caudatus]
MEEGGEVYCPICGNYFELSKINQHANQCLNVLSENTPISAITRKKKCGDSDFASPPRSQKRLKPNEDCQPRPIYHYQYQDNLSASPSTASCSLSILENKDKLSQLVSPASVTVGNKSSREHDKYRCIKAGDTVKLTPTPSSAAVDNIANKKYSTSICNSTSSTATSGPITTSTTSTSTTSSTKPWGIFFNKSKSKEQSEQNDTTTVTTQSNQTKVNGSVSAVPSSSSTSTSTSSEALLNLKPDDDNFKPLAEQMRPTSILDYIGQSKAIGENTMLSSLLEAHKIPSMVLWGPPGCGKTTLARIIAKRCKEKSSTRFVQLSATTSGVADVKQAITQARNEQKMFRRKTVLFIDEIHRFNKLQQDTFLPHVENGTVTLIGATTENPSFHINSALLSRCRVIVLEKLTIDDIRAIVQRALMKLNIGVLVEGAAAAVPVQGDSRAPVMYIQEKAVDVLAGLSDGDARVSLNGLQMAVQAQEADFMLRKELASSRGDCEISGDVENAFTIITTEHIKEGLQQSHLLYDRAEHYNAISALHKSIRGSDENAALYWLVRMLEAGEDPMFVARRLLDAATGDVGLADPMALTHAVAVHQGCHAMGMPACGILLAQLTTYLARAPKSCEISSAYEKARKCIQDHQGALPPVPLHLRNAPTRLMQEIGYGKGYKPVGGQYMPDGMTHVNFY